MYIAENVPGSVLWMWILSEILPVRNASGAGRVQLHARKRHFVWDFAVNTKSSQVAKTSQIGYALYNKYGVTSRSGEEAWQITRFLR